MKAFLFAALVALLSVPSWAGTLERVRETGAFKIGYREDAAPFAFKNEIGEPAGYAVDLCRAVAVGVKEALGLPEISVAYLPVSASNRFEAIEEGRIDILCGPTSVTLSRRERVSFSIPTFMDGAGALLRADGPENFEGLSGHKVGVRDGTTTEQALRNTLKQLALDAEVVPVVDHADGLKQLEARAIAAYFADRGILTFLAASSAAPQRLRLSDRYFTHEPYALAFARGDEDFRLLVDRTLSRLYRSKGIEKIFHNAFGPGAQPSDLVKALYIINRLPE